MIVYFADPGTPAHDALVLLDLASREEQSNSPVPQPGQQG